MIFDEIKMEFGFSKCAQSMHQHCSKERQRYSTNLGLTNNYLWNTESIAIDKILGNAKIQCGIFWGDSLSLLLFVKTMIRTTRERQRYSTNLRKKDRELITHSSCMILDFCEKFRVSR